jgi:hypothetical protein
MGKGTLTTTGGAFYIRSNMHPDLAGGPISFGYIAVGCKDPGESGSSTPVVIGQLPPGIKNKDFVKFDYCAGGLGAKNLKKEKPCKNPEITITWPDEKPVKPRIPRKPIR